VLTQPRNISSSNFIFTFYYIIFSFIIKDFLKYMILWFFLAVDSPRNIPTQYDSDRTQTGKDNSKRQADLSKQLKRQVTVIPDFPTQPFIYDQSGQKFHCRYKDHTAKNLTPQRFLKAKHSSLDIEKQKTDSSKNKHAPVRKATKQYFQSIIDASAKAPQKQILTYFFTHENALTFVFSLHSLGVF